MSLNEYLTIVVPVKNEDLNLSACLENVKAFRNVVIVDSGSTDRTLEIAAEFGREVVQFRWNGQFPKKRNWVLRNYEFKTPWVMFLDADERITAIRQRLSRGLQGVKLARRLYGESVWNDTM